MKSATSISELLLDARKRHLQIEVPQVQTEAMAYVIQESVAAGSGGFAAWKIGAVPPQGLILPAPILANNIVKTGAVFAPDKFFMIGLEAEVAFILNRGFPASRSVLPNEDELIDSVAAVHAAMEIVDTRLASWRSAPTWALLADSLCSGALVLGEELADWRTRTLQSPGFSIRVNGVQVGVPGSNAVADPLSLVAQLLVHCRQRGIDVPPGVVVTTGSSTGMHFVQPGCTAEVMAGEKVMARARFEA